MPGLVSLINLLRRNIITAEHIEAARDTPSYTFLIISFNVRNKDLKMKKFDKLIEEICKLYDVRKQAFKIGRKYVKAIFSLEHGDEEMPISKSGAFIGRYTDGAENDSALMHKFFLSPRARKSGPKNDNSVSNSLIKESIQKAIRGGGEDKAKDVARLLILFICSTLFFSVSGDIVGWTPVFYVENLEKINDYEWSRAILKKPNTSLDKCIKVGKPERVIRCVVVLFPFLMEHSFMEVEIRRPNIIPRCYKWCGLEGEELTMEMIQMVSQLRDSQVMDEELSLTKAEWEAFGRGRLGWSSEGGAQTSEVRSWKRKKSVASRTIKRQKKLFHDKAGTSRRRRSDIEIEDSTTPPPEGEDYDVTLREFMSKKNSTPMKANSKKKKGHHRYSIASAYFSFFTWMYVLLLLIHCGLLHMVASWVRSYA